MVGTGAARGGTAGAEVLGLTHGPCHERADELRRGWEGKVVYRKRKGGSLRLIGERMSRGVQEDRRRSGG